MMHITHMSLVIFLHRPYYRKVSRLPGNAMETTSEAVKVSRQCGQISRPFGLTFFSQQCDRAATRIVTLLRTWHRLHNLRYNTPTALQAAFTAGTTFLLSAVQTRAPKRRLSAIQGVKDCLMLLDHMGHSWTAAAQKAEILASLAADYGVRLDGTDSASDVHCRQPTMQSHMIEEQIGVSHPRQHTKVLPRASRELETMSKTIVSHPVNANEPIAPGHASDFSTMWNDPPFANPMPTLDFDMNATDLISFPPGFDFMDDPDSEMLHMLLDRISVPHAQTFPFQPGLFAPGTQPADLNPYRSGYDNSVGADPAYR
jgi:hypothetical protein